jgi:hypothetical protein
MEKARLPFAQKAIFPALLAALGIGTATARAQDTLQQPAVSGLNGEFSVMGGVHGEEPAILGEGALVVPLGDQFGARWDGLVGNIDGNLVGGVAAHLFWRDPRVGLLGVAGGYLGYDTPGGAHGTGIIAGEGEVYFDHVTISALAGQQFSDDPKNDGFVGRVDLEWYPTDDFLLTAGVETNPQANVLGRFGAEYMPGFDALPGLSAFAGGAFGNDGFQRAFAGVRYYFGQSDTLKARHRNDTFRSHLLPTRMLDGVPQNAFSAYGD